MEKINLAEKLALVDGYYRPGIVATMNDHKVQVVKVKGEFPWHAHADTDDFFLVLDGELQVQLRDRTVVLGPGSSSSCRGASSTGPTRTRRRTSS